MSFHTISVRKMTSFSTFLTILCDFTSAIVVMLLLFLREMQALSSFPSGVTGCPWAPPSKQSRTRQMFQSRRLRRSTRTDMTFFRRKLLISWKLGSQPCILEFVLKKSSWPWRFVAPMATLKAAGVLAFFKSSFSKALAYLAVFFRSESRWLPPSPTEWMGTPWAESNLPDNASRKEEPLQPSMMTAREALCSRPASLYEKVWLMESS
mmetsp:Transcript_68653/g.149428  ORF Transcript_68653/g.149428 Transcript_68653/m.149428 type:complete len:208 (-) Transcript_68653:275-898(-)